MTHDADVKYKRRLKQSGFWPPRLSLSKFVLISAFCFGVYLVINNGYNLYAIASSKYQNPYSVNIPQRNAWIFAKHNLHLRVVLHVLSKAGYNIITSQTEPKQWDLLWAHEFPFRKEFKESLTNLQKNQRVNKLPGTSSITLKVELARTKLKWIPLAYSLPDEATQFHLEASRNPTKLWVQKSNNHRGIRIVSSKDIDVNKDSTFVQQFIENPLLIDKKKFDIGIYVVYTSVDPLTVYMFEDEVLLRFCTEDYLPLDASNPKKYVVGDDYIPLDKMPSLKKYYNHGQMSFQNAFFSYMIENGFDPYKMWMEIRHCISEVFKSKAVEMKNAFDKHNSKENFFELVRVDFVPDEKGNVWLMEINMSPNLSPDSHPINRMMYTKVVRDTLHLGGVLATVDERYDDIMKESAARIRDVLMPKPICSASECLNCDTKDCWLCHHCLDNKMKIILPKIFKEHRNRGSFKRLLPVPLESNGKKTISISDPRGEYDEILKLWFKEKCLKDIRWCQ